MGRKLFVAARLGMHLTGQDLPFILVNAKPTRIRHLNVEGRGMPRIM